MINDYWLLTGVGKKIKKWVDSAIFEKIAFPILKSKLLPNTWTHFCQVTIYNIAHVWYVYARYFEGS